MTAGRTAVLILVGWAALECVVRAAGAEGGGVVVYVDASRPAGRADGRTWATAWPTVQEGLDAAQAAGGGEVWVARGAYTPTAGQGRAVSFLLRKGVALYGGFAGGEKARDQRDWRKNPTILSGDIGQSDVQTDNCYHVVTGADEAVMDGFTVTGGYGLNAGGPGMGPGAGPGQGEPRGGQGQGGPGGGPGGQPIHTSPEAILRGASPSSGAGMVNFQCAPVVRNCTFERNSAGKGGAMYNMTSRSFPPRRDSAAAPAPTVIDCTFRDNFARGRGGAVVNDLGTSPAFRGCAFVSNVCEAKGGAVYNDFGCSPTIVNCLFVDNQAATAAAIGNDGASSPLIVHCTFTRNTARDEGAALYQGTGPANNPVVYGCILWDNRCKNGPAEIFNWHDNEPKVLRSCVQGGWEGEGNVGDDPRFVAPDKGDFAPAPGSPCREMGHARAAPEDLLARLASLRPAPLGPPARRQDSAPPPQRGGQAGLRIVYVSARAAAGGAAPSADGRAWRSAYPTLEQALASLDGPAEIWLAAGTYRPTSGTDRSACFRLRQGVEIYGGFAGTETRRDQRDYRTNFTILSGDIGKRGEAGDNCYHVLVGADQALLDGLVIRDGNADGPAYDGHGGGMVNYRRAPQAGPMGPATGYSVVVQNCLFMNNRAREGGAVYNYDRGEPEFHHCRFLNNSALWGGAMVDRVGVKSTLRQCDFDGNAARWRAGAIYLDYGARPQVADCRFTANTCDRHGGAVAAVSRASQLEATIASFDGCTFKDNRAGGSGGACFVADASTVYLTDCTMADNRAGEGEANVAADARSRAVVNERR